MTLDIDAYLGRIGYEGTLTVDEKTLARLHEAHVGAIPFETLDVVAQLPIPLDIEALQAKMVAGRRGGYCFEHGTLFKAVLDAIGFHTTIMLARVRFGTAGITPRTHMILKVDTPTGAFLADVGFGGAGLLRPLPLMPDLISHVPGAAYRLRHEGGLWILEGDVGGDDFIDYYAFTLEPCYPIDVEVSNHFVATHPRSIFRRTLTAQLTRPDHRVVLRDGVLERRRGGVLSREPVPPEALADLLASEFGLVLPPDLRLPG